jgi:hypothetical protein
MPVLLHIVLPNANIISAGLIHVDGLGPAGRGRFFRTGPGLMARHLVPNHHPGELIILCYPMASAQ